MVKRYNLTNIRTLLIEGFTEEDIRRLCYDTPDFRPVYHQLARNHSQADVIDRLLEYAERTLRIEILLTLLKTLNPARYDIHQPYFSEQSTPSIPPRIEPNSSPDQLPPISEPPKSDQKEEQIDETIYTQLRNFLEVGNLKEADVATAKVFLLTANRQETDLLRAKDIEQLRCSDIRAVDELWKKYSNNRFGFSVQRKIWCDVGGQPGRFDPDIFRKFSDCVGWRIEDEWLREYKKFNFTWEARVGHFPSLRLPSAEDGTDWWGAWRDCFKSFLARIEFCLPRQVSS